MNEQTVTPDLTRICQCGHARHEHVITAWFQCYGRVTRVRDGCPLICPCTWFAERDET